MHVDVGPFETVGARGLGGDGALPELRNTHVAYTVEVPPAGDGRAGSVMFKPRDTGPFAFFVDIDVPFELSAGGRAVCPAAEHRVTACAGLKRAIYFDLERKVEYELAFEERAPAKVLVVVELLPVAEKTP